MPTLPSANGNRDRGGGGHGGDDIEVLLTGFGPFGPVTVNPSWEAVKPLHDSYLSLDVAPRVATADAAASSSSAKSPIEPLDPSVEATAAPSRSRRIHLQCLQSSVCYSNVLSLLPRIHGHAQPVLPPSIASPWLDPHGERASSGFQGDGEHVYPGAYHHLRHPERGYSLVVHVGVGLRGAIKLERLAHKFGYARKDARGDLAPEVDIEALPSSSHQGGHGHGHSGARNDDDVGPSAAELAEAARLDSAVPGREPASSTTPKLASQRGFGQGYEGFAVEETTAIDTRDLVDWIARQGAKHVVESSDPGRYLCDFIYYCSLAEARRSSRTTTPSSANDEDALGTERRDVGRGATRCLFIHVPPAGEPHTVQEMRDVVRGVVWRACERLRAEGAAG